MNIEYYLRLAGAICPRLPTPLGYWLADRIGDVAYWRGGQAVEAVRDNVRHILGQHAGQTQIEQTVRRAFGNRVKSYYDLFRLAHAAKRQVLALLDVTGVDHIQSARALGRGLIMASAHYGNVELLLHATPAALNMPMLAVAEHLKPESVYQYMVALRTRHGLRMIPADGPLRQVYRTIRQGGAALLPLDRDTTASGVWVELFDAPAYLPDGYARLAARTRAPLVVGLGERTPDNRLRLDLPPPYIPAESDDRETVYRQALAYGVDLLRRAIAAHPDQWLLTTPIWKINRQASSGGD